MRILLVRQRIFGHAFARRDFAAKRISAYHFYLFTTQFLFFVLKVISRENSLTVDRT